MVGNMEESKGKIEGMKRIGDEGVITREEMKL